MNRNLMLAAALAAGAWLSPVAAQTVYRCGDSYSQQPCPDAKAVQAEDPRTAAQKLQSLQATEREAQAAHRMQEARLKEEARAARAPADAVPATPASAPEENPAVVRRKKAPGQVAPAGSKAKPAKPKSKKAKSESKSGTDTKAKAAKKA